MGKKSKNYKMLDTIKNNIFKKTQLSNDDIKNILSLIVFFLKQQESESQEQSENSNNLGTSKQIQKQTSGRKRGKPKATQQTKTQKIENKEISNEAKSYYCYRWIHQNCYHKNKFQFLEHTITAKSYSSYLFGRQEFSSKDNFTIFIKLSKGIRVGAASLQYVNQKEDWNKLIQMKNLKLIYYHNTGKISNCSEPFYNPKINGGNYQIYKQGYTINVKVDTQKGELVYRVKSDQTKTITVNQPLLKDKTIQWVPFISFCKDSSVIINPQEINGMIDQQNEGMMEDK